MSTDATATLKPSTVTLSERINSRCMLIVMTMNKTPGPSNLTSPQKYALTINTLAVTIINAWVTPTWEIHSLPPTMVTQRENTNSGFTHKKRN